MGYRSDSIAISCATPGAEPRHEIFFNNFHGCFREGRPAKQAPPELFGGLCCFFTRQLFVDKLGTHSESIANSTETAVKLRKTSPGVRI